MILTVHILAGAAIGSRFSSPVAVFVLALFSHYLLDAIPHYEYKICEGRPQIFQLPKVRFKHLLKIGADIAIGLALVFLLLRGSAFNPIIGWGIFSALLPDGLLTLYWIFPEQKILKLLARPHQLVHFHKKIGLKWLGLTAEIIITVAAIFFLFFYA